ncbi:MAG: dihydrodipicolinate synthase family protein [Phycisphaeraceae bacterium]|nr:dihydrodipicolinate synthase family protein [Phycisphaeraceae bacterium]
MTEARFITAIGTPLTQDDQLHIEGLARHLDDQAAGGIDALLIAGTMGLHQLQSDRTWRDLVVNSIQLSRGRFELLIGVGDHSTVRTLDRITFVNSLDGIHGVVVLTPSFFKYSEKQYIAYYTQLADESRYPLFIYDLQPLTGVHLSVDTLSRLARHPNIAGIKLSANVPEAVRLRMRLEGSTFRIIVAEPVLSDILFRAGFSEHLDGIYAVCPHWASALARAARQEDWDTAAQWQQRLTGVKELFIAHPFGPLFTALMNERGIAGKFAPHPLEQPDPQFIEQLRRLPLVRELLSPQEMRADHVRT